MLGLPKVARAIVYKAAQTLLLLLAISVSAQANTIVRVSTTFGDFSLELFDDLTPVTAEFPELCEPWGLQRKLFSPP